MRADAQHQTPRTGHTPEMTPAESTAEETADETATETESAAPTLEPTVSAASGAGSQGPTSVSAVESEWSSDNWDGSDDQRY